MDGQMGGRDTAVSETTVVCVLEHVPTPTPVLGPSLAALQRCLATAYAPGSLGLAATQGGKRRPWSPRTMVSSSLPGK